MKIYNDIEIKQMAGHPDCIHSSEIESFLRGFRKAEELFYNDQNDQNGPFLKYCKEPPHLPYMYPHLKEEMITNHNFDKIEEFRKKISLYSFNKETSNNYPEFVFEYMYDLDDGEYDFEIGNAKFTHCKVKKQIIDDIRMYSSTDYYVFFNL